jgi:signal transduction histidine kinase
MEGIGQVFCDDSGRPLRMMGICMDVTERKSTEEKLRQSENQLRQAQKMEAVGRVAGGVAHDFNNLLSVIIGYSDVSLEQLEPETELYKSIAQIKKAGECAASLTRQLLAFSRQQILEPQLLNLSTVVADVTKMLRRMIGENVNLTNVLCPVLRNVKADRGQIEQVLMNLAVNARDAMPQGGQLTIETANLELEEAYARLHAPFQPGQYVTLTVADTGCGIDPETQAHIFEPFFTTKEPGKGTGLGLATVYGVVKQSGGYIWVSSEPGQGTTFKIYLPTVDEPSGTGELSELPLRSTKGTETVLVVEDDEPIRNFICECLERQGYSVVSAGDPVEAVEAAERHKGMIQLMVTDVVMPGVSGRELAEQLAPRRPEMKVLFVSGYTDDAIVHYGVLEAGLAFLQKPFTRMGLAQKVREVLGCAPPQSIGKPPDDWVIWGKKQVR